MPFFMFMSSWFWYLYWLHRHREFSNVFKQPFLLLQKRVYIKKWCLIFMRKYLSYLNWCQKNTIWRMRVFSIQICSWFGCRSPVWETCPFLELKPPQSINTNNIRSNQALRNFLRMQRCILNRNPSTKKPPKRRIRVNTLWIHNIINPRRAIRILNPPNRHIQFLLWKLNKHWKPNQASFEPKHSNFPSRPWRFFRGASKYFD